MSAKRLERLLPEQARAAEPGVHAWVSASAGTGKTQVLSARVLRLLLAGVPAANILCITFTKLAAAEMQERVLGRLAFWARADDAVLAQEVAALGEPVDEAGLARARRLFAVLLDSPQGLAVQTIHAFSQSLIGSFPVEAGVAPGFQTLDDRAGQALRRDLLRVAIEEATGAGDAAFLDDIATLSLNGGEALLMKALQGLGRHADALIGLGQAAVEPMLRRRFGLGTDETADAALARGLAAMDDAGVRRLARAWAQAGNVKALASADLAAAWLADRGDFESLRTLCLTQKNEARAESTVPVAAERGDPGLRGVFKSVAEAVQALVRVRSLHAVIAVLAAQLRVMRRLAGAWVAAKAEAGVIDYDDMIGAARRLLATPGAAEWVRWKLDQRIDHILVDEAQDTNLAQWEIIEALSEEFFAGAGARDAARRLFVVGDYKQAIFGFQGSDPDVYEDRREYFEQLAEGAGSPLQTIALTTNFRSVPGVLDVVDAVADALEAAGAPLARGGVPKHVPHRRDAAGAVVVLPPTDSGDDDDDEGEEADFEADGERLGQGEIDHARALAAMMARWLDARDPLMLPGRGRPVAPQDILVLVRRRTAFSAALVAALHGHGVPVAGVDRLKLSEPLAVADLLALVRFAVLPDDDLTLACLLVSPFCGLDHDALFGLAHLRAGSLWAAMRESDVPAVVAAREWLAAVLGFADFAAPYEFLERVLSGPLGGRAKLLARLGEEARDAVETMLDQALAYEALHAPSLQGFLAWMEAEDIEIKRDPDAPLDAVRLMTVHGAKGLQAPVVVLADTTHAPNLRANGPLLMEFDGAVMLPIDPGGTKGLGGPLEAAAEAAKADALAEHWRLLYVALTRAEDLLFVAGAKPKKGVDALSWHGWVEAAMTGMGAVREEDRHHGGTVLVHRTGAAVPPVALGVTPEGGRMDLPDWVRGMAPVEARPPRPLTPSALAPDMLAAPPAGPAAAAAARRGSALHVLFERLPGVEPGRRRVVGEAFAARLLPGGDAAALVDEVLAVLEDPAFAAVFAEGSLAEAPIAAVVGETVITGQVDRLLIEDGRVTIVDFKTSRRVPGDARAVPPGHVAQMAGYAAAVRRVFPGREVVAALLYTAGPRLIVLPALGMDELNGGASVTILPMN